MKPGWTAAALGDVVRFQSGGTPSRNHEGYWHGDLPWITGADISPNGAITPRAHVTNSALSDSAARMVPAGTLLLVTRTAVGKNAVTTFPLAFSQDITAITPSSHVDIGYLSRFLSSHAPQLASAARGATIKGVTREVVSGIRIPLPPLDEQRRIAAALDYVDTLHAMRLESTRLLDAMPRALFEELFVRGTMLSWPRTTVAEVASSAKSSIRTGPFGSQLLKEEFVDSGIPVLGIDNVVTNAFRWGDRRFIKPDKYRELERYTVHPGDVLITIMGTVGRCAIVPDDIPTAINTKHLCCITLDQDRCLPEFLRASFLWHPDSLHYLNATKKGAIMAGLNMGIIKSLPLTLPPIWLQKEFARRLDAVESVRSWTDGHLAELDALFTSLQARAFAGELDVDNVRLPPA
ncbi:restriction endonuclease subunit S [Cellulosimicrobium cellulans]|uniref:restriction endonuclease subunit S n=1 Tax=Cellulosimicrobium cellulans TaxID=1710 RepID=UPI0020CC3DD5|nr:restriction endonuclease subunit S [Cellulosimicrobium cellulans]